MKKSILFNQDLTKNEKKTLAAFVEIKNGVPTLVQRRLAEVCKITCIVSVNRMGSRAETDKSYQLSLLTGLIEKGICEKKGYYYNIIPKYHDWVFNSLIQNKIRDLGYSGLFRLLDTYIFGIKKDWSRYPEIKHLHSIIIESLHIQWRMKQIKKICLIRDFGKKWKDFLKTDIHPAVKHWLWLIVTQQLSSPYEKTIEETQLENYKAQLELYGIENEEEVRKINKNLKDVRSKIRKDLNYKPQSNLSPYSKKLQLALKKYNERYSSLIIRYVKTNDECWDTVKEILQSVLLEYPEALEEIGEYIDISSQKTDGLGIKYKLPEDKEEKIFKSITSIRYDRLLEKTIKNKDKKIEDFINLNNFINVHRYHLREVSVIVNQIPEPKWVLFTKPRLESLKEDIKKKVKTEYNENEYEVLFDNIIRYCPVLNREFYLEKINGEKNSNRNRTAN